QPKMNVVRAWRRRGLTRATTAIEVARTYSLQRSMLVLGIDPVGVCIATSRTRGTRVTDRRGRGRGNKDRPTQHPGARPTRGLGASRTAAARLFRTPRPRRSRPASVRLYMNQ